MWLGVGKGYAGFYRKSLAIFLRLFLSLAKTEHMFYYWLIGGLSE